MESDAKSFEPLCPKCMEPNMIAVAGLTDTKRSKLFHRAQQLFGRTSSVTTALQNPGCITTKEDLVNIFGELKQLVEKKVEQLEEWSSASDTWFEDLCKAFEADELK